jgi:hypothetical protein
MPLPTGLLPKHLRSRNRAYGMVPFIGGTAPANYGVLPPKMSALGNNKYGCCVSSEEFARLQVYSVMRNLPEVTPTDDECISFARQHGLLNGADLSNVMDIAARDGTTIGGTVYKEGPPQSVDWTKFEVLCPAIYTGPVKIAISAGPIENAGAGSRNGWVLTGQRRNKATNHCVGLWSFGTAQFLADLMHTTYNVSVSLGSLGPQAPCVVLYSWGTVGIVDMPSLSNITDEAYVRGPTVLPDFAPTPTPGPNPIRTGTIVIDLGSNSVLAPPHTVINPTPTATYSYDPLTGQISGPAGLLLVPSP